VPKFARFLRFLQEGERSEQDVSLPVNVPHVSDRSSVGKLNARSSGNAHNIVEFRSRCEYYRAELRFLEEPGSQSNGLATEGSSRGEEHRVNSFLPHIFCHRLDGRGQVLLGLPLEAIE
jgi:hypothetical protein